MALRGRRILGIAVEDRSLLVAELRLAGRRAVLARAAEFAFPDGASLDEPAALGRELRAFLRQERFGTKQAALGLPARWLLAREKAFPPANQDAFRQMARLEAEQAFGGQDLVVDCTAGAAAGGSRSVLMVASARSRLDQLAAMAKAAGLDALAAFPTVLALGGAGKPADGQELTLYLRPEHAEVAVRDGGRFRVVRHLPGASAAGIRDGMRQVVALLPQGDAAAGPGSLVIWDGATPGPEGITDLTGEFPLPTTVRSDLSALGVVTAPAVSDAEAVRFAAPAAVALAALQPGGPAVDLLHSRLALPRKRVVARRLAWAVVLVAALAAAGVTLVDDWRTSQNEVADLRVQMDEMKPDLEAAESIVAKFGVARAWYGQRPHFLDCLRELTLAFPERGTIWATSIAIREDMQAVVSGKSVDEQTVLEVLDQLKQSKALAEAKLLHMREAGGRGREISFAIRFTYVGSE